MAVALWLRAYGLLVQWQALRLRTVLPFVMLVQALLAAAVILGFGLLLPHADREAILYLATGAPTIILIVVGLVLVPQQVAQAKSEGSYAYMRSLPVPRLAYLAADTTVWLLASLPGLALGIVVAELRYDINYSVSPLLAPAVVLVVLTSTGVGYAIAAVAQPAVAGLISQVLVFVVLLFSPINYPVDRLPPWLRVVHDVAPVKYIAELIRGTLASDVFALDALPFIVVGAWCVVGFAAAHAALARRG